jgi:hypothetical protein
LEERLKVDEDQIRNRIEGGEKRSQEGKEGRLTQRGD